MITCHMITCQVPPRPNCFDTVAKVILIPPKSMVYIVMAYLVMANGILIPQKNMGYIVMAYLVMANGILIPPKT